MSWSNRSAAVATAATVALCIAGSVRAADSGQPLEEVVITGSRIATPELESITPVTILKSKAIEASGNLNISDFLRALPSVGTSALSSTNSNFLTADSGINSINLRNLGDQRTLVLVNGKRYVPGISGSSIVDFNTIPTDFIDRIEVSTGGASAIYGSDAIAGVVNVIYKTDFQGLRFRAQTGETSKGDSQRYGGAITAGSLFADGRGNFMLNISYDRDKGLWSRDRSRSAVDQTVLGGVLVKPTYSSYAPQGRFQYTSLQGGDGGLFTYNPDGTLKLGFSSAVNGFNRNAYRRLSVPTERTLVASTMNLELNDHNKVYAEFTYAHSLTESDIEPLPLAGANSPGAVYGTVGDANGDLIAMPITNAYLQTLPELQPIRDDINTWNATGANCTGDINSNPAYDCVSYINFRKRLVDVAIRSNSSTRQSMRSIFGIKGDLPFKDWTYDASFSYGRTTDAQITTGEVNLANFRAALDSVVDPATGNVVCRDPVWQALGCVPINIFGFHSITPAAAAWVNATVTRNAKVQEQVLSVSTQGSVAKLPAGDMQLVIGVEERRDSSAEIYDPLTNAGLNGGNALPNVLGSLSVKEAFAETEVPILKNVTGAESLSFDAAIRHADYNTVGGVNTWKVGFGWAPIHSLRFRGVYSEAIRAPNINELYGGQAETFPTGLVDPCDGITAATAGQFPAACAAIPGVATAIANGGSFTYSFLDYQSINGFVGSNPNLTQEKAKTKTLGIVVTPSGLPRLSATVDYYDVKIEKAVSVVDFQTEINQCLATGTLCGSVIRNAVTGKLQTVNQISLNVASIRTSGIDTVIKYGWDLEHTWLKGGISLALSESHLLKLEEAVPGVPLLDNVGELNSGANGRLGSGFKDRATLTAVYARGGLEATWKINYLSSINDTNPTPDNTVISDLYNHVPAYMYNDVNLRYTLPERTHTAVYVGANNVFNKQPPLLPSGMASEVTGAETAADTYDVFGAFFYAGFEVKL
jgi:outer membrane receptor protein involved in Fe transport